jgi:DHA2 family multidrug resistance protein
VIPTLLQGIPMALFFVPLTDHPARASRTSKIPAAAGLSNFVRVFCGAVGTSLATTAWNDRSILHHSQLAEQASPNNPVFVDAIAQIQQTLGFSHDQALAYFERTLNIQASMLGLNDIFWISAVIFLAIIPLIWFTKPGKGGGGAAAAAAH